MSDEFRLYSAVQELVKSLHAQKTNISPEQITNFLKKHLNNPNTATQVKVHQAVRSITENAQHPLLYKQTYDSTASRIRDTRSLNNFTLVLQGLSSSQNAVRVLNRFAKRNDCAKKLAQIVDQEARKTDLLINAQEKTLSPSVKYTADDIRNLTKELANISAQKRPEISRNIPAHLQNLTGNSTPVASPAKFEQSLAQGQTLSTTCLNESITKTPGGSGDASTSGIFIPDWCSKRAHSSSSLIPSATIQNKVKLGTLPLYEQEYELVQDLLCIFVGITGRWINVRIDEKSHLERTFMVDSSVEQSLRAATEKLLPLGMAYHKVNHFVKNVAWLPSAGQTLNALGAAMRMCLNDHRLAINTINNQHIQSRGNPVNAINLQRLHAIVTGPDGIFRNIQLLQNIAISLDRGGQRGAAVLSWLSERANDTGDMLVESMYQSLMNWAEEPYMQTMDCWLRSGEINNSDFQMCANESARKEFLVAENQFFSKQKLKTDYNDQFWERRFMSVDGKCPSHLMEYRDKILKTGKYVRVINQCLKKKTLQSGQVPTWQPPTPSTPFNTIYDEIEAFYRASSHQLLKILVQEHGLFDHLLAVRRYLLFGEAGSDAISHLLSIANSELFSNAANAATKTLLNRSDRGYNQWMGALGTPRTPTPDVGNVFQLNTSKISRIFELSLKSTVACKDSLHEYVKVELKNADYITELAKILSMHTNTEFDTTQETLDVKSLENLSLVDIFCLNWESEWPNNIVLSRKNLTHYQMLFRHFLNCKVVESKLTQVWQSGMSRFKQKDLMQIRIFTIRCSMLSFVRSFQYYMNNEVIEPNWNIFRENLSTVSDLDQVLDFQNTFLETCMKDCLLSNKSLLEVMAKLLETCLNFSKFTEKLQGGFEEENSLAPKSTDFIDKQLDASEAAFHDGIVDLIHKLNDFSSRSAEHALFGLAQKLNYNGYYDMVEVKT